MPPDEKDGSPSPAPQDEIKNLKAEFSRKMTNIEQTSAALKATQEALLAEVTKLVKPASSKPETENLSELMYRDPDGYAKRVLEQAERAADARFNQAAQAQSKQNQLISSIAKEYPEITNGDHELTLLAIEKFNGMDAAEKNSTAAYRAAVNEAAAELGIKPKSKRPKADPEDEYVGGSSSGSSERRTQRKNNKLDPRTEEFAQLVGIDTSKPEVKERLTNNHGRDTYLKWK